MLESTAGNPILKKLSVNKLIELKQFLNLSDIWQIRSPKSKTITFWQRHSSGICREDVTIYLFQTICKNRLKIWKY